MKQELELRRRERVRRSQQFEQIYTGGQRLHGPHLTIFCRPNQLNFNRLGLSVPKKRFKLSSQRHSIQRRLREAYRRNKNRFLPGYDIVINARRFDKDKTRFKEIEQELLSLAQKARLLNLDTVRG